MLLRPSPSCCLLLRSGWTPRTTPTPATAPTVLRLRLPRGDAAEQRLDRGAHFLLNHVPDHRQQAPLSRHRILPCRRQIPESPITSKVRGSMTGVVEEDVHDDAAQRDR